MTIPKSHTFNSAFLHTERCILLWVLLRQILFCQFAVLAAHLTHIVRLGTVSCLPHVEITHSSSKQGCTRCRSSKAADLLYRWQNNHECNGDAIKCGTPNSTSFPYHQGCLSHAPDSLDGWWINQEPCKLDAIDRLNIHTITAFVWQPEVSLLFDHGQVGFVPKNILPSWFGQSGTPWVSFCTLYKAL